jgi:hypothetical protein
MFYSISTSPTSSGGHPAADASRGNHQIRSRPGATILVNGHTDDVGTADYNMQLSERRARAVAQWFVERKYFADSSLKPQGFGKTVLRILIQQAAPKTAAPKSLYESITPQSGQRLSKARNGDSIAPIGHVVAPPAAARYEP